MQLVTIQFLVSAQVMRWSWLASVQSLLAFIFSLNLPKKKKIYIGRRSSDMHLYGELYFHSLNFQVASLPNTVENFGTISLSLTNNKIKKRKRKRKNLVPAYIWMKWKDY